MMMTMQLDMTAELAAIPYGLAFALGVSFVCILAHVSRDEIRAAKMSLVDKYHQGREALRRRAASPVQTASSAR